jgi:hypothetical protein
MAVSIKRLRKDIEGIKSLLGECILNHEDKAAELIKKVNKIVQAYQSSNLYLFDEAGMAGTGLNDLSTVLTQAVQLNKEYEEFLCMIGYSRV